MPSDTTLDEHGQARDRRGEWRSGKPVAIDPMFDTPWRPGRILRGMISFPGFLMPYFALFVGITLAAYAWATPAVATMQTLAPGWILAIIARNAALLVLFTGGLHLWLYGLRRQGRWRKYNAAWPATNDKRFLFRDQVRDNVFWSFVAVLSWSGYEVLLWWAYANDWLPYAGWMTNPVWCTIWLIFIPFWRNFHFYWIHRLIHWPPLYKRVHYLHHKNINVGPWSGLAMHPVEHALYFSCMLIHVVIPSHPIHMMFNGIQTALGPALSHSGFDEIMLNDHVALKNERVMHYLHHRYHTVNFGESNVPLDRWFGSFHDGTPEADARFKQARVKG